MFDRVLSMPLDYLPSSAVVLKGIHSKIYAKLIMAFTPNKSHTWNYNIQANERLTSFVLSLIFCSSVPDNTQLAIICSKLTKGTLEQGVKYVQS